MTGQKIHRNCSLDDVILYIGVQVQGTVSPELIAVLIKLINNSCAFSPHKVLPQ